MTRLYHLHQNRFRLVTSFFLLTNMLILSRMFFIQSFQSDEFREITNKIGFKEKLVQGHRGQILDRNGEVLAETIHKYTFWVNTQKKFDKENIIDIFSSVLNQPEDGYRKFIRNSFLKILKILK